MKTVARITLGIVLLMAGMAFLPQGAARVVPAAIAQIVPTPTVPDILPTPTETEIVDPDKDDDDKDDDDDKNGPGGGGNGPGGGGNKNDNDNNTDGNNTGDNTGDNTGRNKVRSATEDVDGNVGARARKRAERALRKSFKSNGPIYTGTYRPSGSFNTDKLTAIAAHLRSLGWSKEEVIRKVFPPFIIAGPAAWTNTWGAPRYGPAPGQIRTHEGQDVFCDYGDPVLATESGTIEFDNGGLGGITVRLFRKDGSYWYYTHLSAVNKKEFSTGDSVKAGDVVGFCGNSGNAITTPPHVHFGWYQPSGAAKNPHKQLVSWLRKAENNALDLVGARVRERIENIAPLTAQRRFGDAFLPSRAELTVPSESLWASGSYPASGAFGLAEAALQAALSDSFVNPETEQETATIEASAVDPALSALGNDSIFARVYKMGQPSVGAAAHGHGTESAD